MTKAQQVRRRRLEAITVYEEEIKKIFNWILDRMDNDTENGNFNSLEVILYEDSTNLIVNSSNQYDLSEILTKVNRVCVFNSLNELFKKEQGFKSKLNLNDKQGNQINAITFTVDVE